jgi:hypothetical protein
MRRLLIMAVTAVLTALAPAAARESALPVVPSIRDPAFQAEILNAHNRERRPLGVAPLVWSDALAEEAEAWAARLAAANRMTHDRQRRHGENLFMNSAGRRSVAQMVQFWTDEKLFYLPGAPHPHVSSTGDWHDVGHYTAIVWAGTRSVGCAIARNASSDFLVCRYDPPGNRRGYAAYDVETARRTAVAAAPPPASAPPVVRPPHAAQPAAPRRAVEMAVVVPVVTADEPWPVPAAKPGVIAR